MIHRLPLLRIALICAASIATIIAARADAAVAVQPPASACRTFTAQLREHLEGVTEAWLDGRAAALEPAAKRAQAFWSTRRQDEFATPSGDSLMQALLGAARRRDNVRAAHLAVSLSVRTFEWCGARASTDDDLMRLDLVGAVGWLRASGEHEAWPAGLHESTARIESQLTARHRADLAKRLAGAVAALLAQPEGAGKSTKPAGALLDLVDEMEKALR